MSERRVPKWTASAAAPLLLSRIDGTLDITDLAALSGLAEADVEQTLAPFVESGLIVITGDAPPVSIPPPNALTPLSETERITIKDLYAKLETIDHYRLLGTSATADLKTIKSAYFAAARSFHPDRFFTKDVGTLRSKIDAIFHAMSTALATLSDKEERASYDAYLRERLKTRIAGRQAEALEEKGEWAAAATIRARIVEQLPTDAHLLHRYAYALLRAKRDLPIASGIAKRAIELDPNRAEYHVTAACILVSEGLDQTAAGELRIACELEPDRQEAATLLAALEERLNLARAPRP
jgi:hypothetical protein